MTVVTSTGQTIRAPLPESGALNPYCADFKPEAVDLGENAQSIGLHVRFGDFRLPVARGPVHEQRIRFEVSDEQNRIGGFVSRFAARTIEVE